MTCGRKFEILHVIKFYIARNFYLFCEKKKMFATPSVCRTDRKRNI